MKKFNDDMLFSKALRERLDFEAAISSDFQPSCASWYALKMLGSGHKIIERNYDPNLPIEHMPVADPPPAQMVWADAICKLLNRECGHDGVWIVGFTHPPGFADLVRVNPRFNWLRVIKLWMDNDGDVAFTCDCIDPWDAVAAQAPEHFVEQAEEAWNRWKTIMRDALDPQEHQLKPLAQLKQRGLA